MEQIIPLIGLIWSKILWRPQHISDCDSKYKLTKKVMSYFRHHYFCAAISLSWMNLKSSTVSIDGWEGDYLIWSAGEKLLTYC